MMDTVQIPTYDRMMNPLLQALQNLGGSGTIEEITNEVITLLDLSDEQTELPHDSEKSSRTELEYRLAWTRTYLKKYGLLENSSRGVWALTAKARENEKINERKVVRYVREQNRKQAKQSPQNEDTEETETWRDELMQTILNIEPSGFERLTQRLLREAGFVQVEVKGRSGDGGIDGIGLMRLGGFISFRVLFQCKRWKGSIGASVVRDFRGAMMGRADKGLIVTTGNFTKDAMKEATRDGATAIELIDGNQLIDRLKEFGLGVTTQQVITEKVTIDHDWFSGV
jgi:restriction system protein